MGARGPAVLAAAASAERASAASLPAGRERPERPGPGPDILYWLSGLRVRERAKDGTIDARSHGCTPGPRRSGSR
jgi:hypothetical protein